MPSASRLTYAFKIIWFNFAFLATLMVGFECLAYAYFAISGTRTDPVARLAGRMPGNGYPDSGDDSWFRAYAAQELSCLQVDWAPYLYWRRRPCDTKYIHVDHQRRRATWNQTSAGSSGVIHIAMFGGSTMWGTGARDEFTIPSYVSKKLAEKYPHRFTITNYGELGYVSTQELISLLREIQASRITDIAVFYDGYNDTIAAFQERVAGVPQNEVNRRREFNLLNRVRIRDLYGVALAGTNTSQLLHSVGQSIWPEAGQPALDATESVALARDVITVYMRNMETMRALANHFGFRCQFFWQPTVFTKEPRTRSEERVRRGREPMRPFFEHVDETVKRSTALSGLSDFHDLAEVFDGHNQTVFIDPGHTTELANEIIAREIVGRLDDHLQHTLSFVEARQR